MHLNEYGFAVSLSWVEKKKKNREKKDFDSRASAEE
jgi:hypothetical protein